MFGFNSKNEFPKSQLIPLIIKLGDYLKQGYDHSKHLQESGVMSVDVDVLSMFLHISMKDWNPCINNTQVLDEETKKAVARFLAGVAINLTKRENNVERN